MATHPHNGASPNELDHVMRNDGQVAATSAMQPMVASSPVSGYRIPGWLCQDCGARSVAADHLCDERAARLADLYGRPITAEEHASWQAARR